MKYFYMFLCCAIIVLAATISADDSLLTNDSLPVDTMMTQTVSETENMSANSIYPMSEERRDKLTAYSQFRNIWRFVDFFLSLGILILILFTGLSAKFQKIASNIPKKFFALSVFVILFLIVEFILNLPFQIYSSFLVESEFGFVNQTFGNWFFEAFLSFLISIPFTVIPAWFIYWLINRSKYWWLQFALGSIPFIIFALIIFPIFISPLFNDYVELENQELQTEILQLADANGIKDADIFQVNASKQSSKVNAYVTGVMNSKRIVLYDNLINNFTSNEIIFVMGHEMGHYVLNHIWIGLFISIVFTALALWLTGLTIQRFIDRFKRKLKFEKAGDMAALPLLLVYISVIMFLFNPVMNSLSRYHEHQSDIYALEHTDVSGDEAAIAFDKLSAYNLSNPDPHPFIEFWFYSHPSIKSRMEFVRSYQRSN